MAGSHIGRGLKMCVGVFVMGVYQDKCLCLTLNGNSSEKGCLIEEII